MARLPKSAEPIEPATAQDILSVMGRTIKGLQTGDTQPAVANAIVNSAGSMLRAVKLQMDYAKARGETPAIPFLAGVAAMAGTAATS